MKTLAPSLILFCLWIWAASGVSGQNDPYFKNNADATNYCIPWSDCSFGDGLTAFAIENIQNYASGCSPEGYGDFTGMTATLAVGGEYSVFAETGYDGNFLSVWVDFNDDGEFMPDELLIEDFLLEFGGQVYEIIINIPADVPPGPHRLRARAVFDWMGVGPCEDADFGETEDYTVELTDMPVVHDVGIVSIDLDTLLAPGLVDPKVTLHNYGTVTETPQVSIINGVDYGTSAWVPDLLPGETRQVTFSSWNAQIGTYMFHSYLSDPDNNPYNDQFFLEVVVEQPDLMPPQNLNTGVMRNNVSLWWDPPASKNLLGYNVYNNGVMVADTLPVPFYTDHCLVGGTYTYMVTAVYTLGESMPCPAELVGIELCDVLVRSENFENYAAGQQLVLQAQAAGIDYWHCWSQPAGSDEDPFISDERAFEGDNALLTEGVNDAWMELCGKTSGCWLLDFMFFVPGGYDGFFGIWKEVATLTGGMEVYFDEAGTAAVIMAGQDWQYFDFAIDSWLAVQVVVDLDVDWAKFYLDGNLVCQGEWSPDANGLPGPLKLDMIDFYAGVIWGGTPRSFADRIRFTHIIDESLPPQNLAAVSAANTATLSWDAPMEGFVDYAVFRNGGFLANTPDTSYTDEGLAAGDYQYTVAALYGECQSPATGPAEVTIHPCHTILLPAGWSGISSYLIPEDPEIAAVLEPLSGNLQIATGDDGIFYPAQNINTLINWNSHKAYHIKLSAEATLQIFGPEEADPELQLQPGWNLIPVLSTCEVDAAQLFQDPALLMVKETSGLKTYWPAYGINTIGMLLPGRAYLVYTTSAITIEFPECSP